MRVGHHSISPTIVASARSGRGPMSSNTRNRCLAPPPKESHLSTCPCSTSIEGERPTDDESDSAGNGGKGIRQGGDLEKGYCCGCTSHEKQHTLRSYLICEVMYYLLIWLQSNNDPPWIIWDATYVASLVTLPCPSSLLFEKEKARSTIHYRTPSGGSSPLHLMTRPYMGPDGSEHYVQASAEGSVRSGLQSWAAKARSCWTPSE